MNDDILGGEESGLLEDTGIIKTDGFGKKIFQKNIDTVMHESMMPYSEHVILDRALPRVEDGLKPSQRRILFSMMELGVTPDKPHKKSARIVGECLGKYHPHGDTSVYEAMVRMAQSFNMRACLVDGHGNFGSVDGDSAAAMRYTEARMTPLALEMLRDIDKDTVPFEFNFDDTIQEPTMLPSRFPNLLVNGASGIAVGLATNIPPHNLAEVINGVCAYIDKPNITLDQMMQIIPAPDFPTGGYIIAKEELKQAYETGRGKIKLRAKVNVEEINGKQVIVISELPYQVNKARLLQRILELRDARKELQTAIAEIADESDRQGMRATVKLKKDADAKEVLDILFKYTDLETSYGINMVAIADGRPQQMGLLDIIAYYVDYQRQIIVRRTKFDLDAARERAHILEGLVIAISNIDEVVKIIKKSANTTEAKAKLKERFTLSERQAQAILDMKLSRLTNLEIEKLKAELEQLRALIEKLQAILSSRRLQFETIKTELGEIKRRFADSRRAKILTDISEFKYVEERKEPVIEKTVVVLSGAGTIKRMSLRAFSTGKHEMGDNTAWSETVVASVSTQTNKNILAFTNLGNAIKLQVADIPEMRLSSKGILPADLALGADKETICSIFELPENLESAGELIFYSSGGMIKRSSWIEYNLQKSTYQAVKLKDGETLTGVEQFIESGEIIFVTENGICLRADKTDIPPQGRISAGVKGVAISDGDKLIFAGQATDKSEIVLLSCNAYAKRVIASDIDVLARYRKGVKIFETKDPFGKLIFAKTLDSLDFDILCEGTSGTFGHSTTEIAKLGRTLKPTQLKQKTKIKKAQKF